MQAVKYACLIGCFASGTLGVIMVVFIGPLTGASYC